MVCLAMAGTFGVYRVKGGPVRYYRAEAVFKTANRPALRRDLASFHSDAVRREIASALGWIKPNPSSAQLAAALDKLAHVLAWEAEGQDRVRLSGIGKDPAGIAWVVNTAVKTTVSCSAHLVSPTPWRVMLLAQPITKPWKVEGWKPLVFGAAGGALLGLILFGGKRKKSEKADATPAAEALPTLLTHIQEGAAAQPPVEVVITSGGPDSAGSH